MKKIKVPIDTTEVGLGFTEEFLDDKTLEEALNTLLVSACKSCVVDEVDTGFDDGSVINNLPIMSIKLKKRDDGGWECKAHILDAFLAPEIKDQEEE